MEVCLVVIVSLEYVCAISLKLVEGILFIRIVSQYNVRWICADMVVSRRRR